MVLYIDLTNDQKNLYNKNCERKNKCWVIFYNQDMSIEFYCPSIFNRTMVVGAFMEHLYKIVVKKMKLN